MLLRPKFRSNLTVSDVLTYVRWLREGAMFVNDAPPLEEWLLARFSDPDDAYLSWHWPGNTRRTTWSRVTAVPSAYRTYLLRARWIYLGWPCSLLGTSCST